MKAKNKLIFLLGILLVLSLPLVMAVTRPPIPVPHIRDFAYDESRIVFRFFSLFVDKNTMSLGDSEDYPLTMTARVPDSDYTDGTYQTQFFGAVWTDKDGNVVESREFRRIYGSYSETFEITPRQTGEYALVALIIQYNQKYEDTGWTTSKAKVLVKDARKLTVTQTNSQSTTQTQSRNIFQQINDWINGLFG